MAWRDWAGYFAVSTYEVHHDREYNAIRNAAALIDISPLFKYRVTGRDAARLVDRVVTRDVPKMAVGQVAYTHWCDGDGKVIDDGTVSRLQENVYRWTAADPSLRWIRENSLGLDAQVEDVSEQTAAVALQGPTSRDILKACAGDEITSLKYFRVRPFTIAGVGNFDCFISGDFRRPRTNITLFPGDIGCRHRSLVLNIGVNLHCAANSVVQWGTKHNAFTRSGGNRFALGRCKPSLEIGASSSFPLNQTLPQRFYLRRQRLPARRSWTCWGMMVWWKRGSLWFLPLLWS
jgi:hypothetical protein